LRLEQVSTLRLRLHVYPDSALISDELSELQQSASKLTIFPTRSFHCKWSGSQNVKLSFVLITAMNTSPTMEKSSLQKQQSDRLIFYGILLFLLGLIVGLFVPLFGNPRMGLSSHLEGIMNGMFLVMLGLIWGKVALSKKWLKITFGLAIFGTFANWLGILIAAIFNAGKDLNVAANGQEGSPLAEGVVMFLLISLSLAMLTICITVLIGLRRNIKA
jgi:(hydroxyamino)benzene mutase